MKNLISAICLLFALCTFAQAQYYGSKIDEKGALPMQNLKAKMGAKKELNVKLSGKIDAVCQKKGCWMNLVGDDGSKVRVTFKDYAFFVPKDAAGKTAIVDGVAKVEETPVSELKEYAKDAGKSKAEIDAIKQPKRELVFEANGVLIK